MRAAPPVEMPLAPGRAERLGIVVLYGAAGAALGSWMAGWWLGGMLPHGPLALSMGLAVMSALVGAWHCRRLLLPQPRTLRWTGEVWMVSSGSVDGGCGSAAHQTGVGAGVSPQVVHDLQLQIDLGDWLLLRWRAEDGRMGWSVASRGQAGPAWHPMSVALRAHTGRAAHHSAGLGRPPSTGA